MSPHRLLTVAERWNGTSWQMVPTPDPPSATGISLSGVSCPRPNVCFAVGGSATVSSSPDTRAPQIERWNGANWSHQPSPDVGNGGLAPSPAPGPGTAPRWADLSPRGD